MRESSSAGAGSPEEGVLALGGQARLLAGTDLELATVEGGRHPPEKVWEMVHTEEGSLLRE